MKSDWPKDGTWQLYQRLSSGRDACLAYAKYKHALWIDNKETNPLYHFRPFPMLAGGAWAIFCTLLLVADVPITILFIIALVPPAVGLRYWNRSWGKIVDSNVVPKTQGDFMVRAHVVYATGHAHTSYLAGSHSESQSHLSWPNFCVGCCAQSPTKKAYIEHRYDSGLVRSSTRWNDVPICDGCMPVTPSLQNFWQGENLNAWSRPLIESSGGNILKFINHSYGVLFYRANPGSEYICSECEKAVADTAKVCPGCGFKQPDRGL